jgi:hypothetical protein
MKLTFQVEAFYISEFSCQFQASIIDHFFTYDRNIT